MKPKLVPPAAMYRLMEPVPFAYSRISLKYFTILVTDLFAMGSPTQVSHPVLPQPQRQV